MSVMTAVETEIGWAIDAERGVTGSRGVAVEASFGAPRRSAIRQLAAGTAALVAAARLGFAIIGHRHKPEAAGSAHRRPVEMVVTAIEVTGPAGPGSPLPAPAGCPGVLIA